ncbi:hypothetical protein TTHERM_00469260 (macronuclear) [Tetrahymena thermophila SB210]|uniref:Uncharacterized protein n=1 Tax=Tetrahymena thermophila (strain SB210) TaxID=312017 RepID=I7MMH7_TETTS|nr:hypothetical protein TTHERM_00469260 [Tetrahymena thermophila SB210]EAS04877.2 hypothetical protein TTHERM_00469260 [Tetrahymena thermophila SB210]|eukprot:XP_001025122.2 hypothetical protein TTHERM_00469260 [Tetrahymena thermophila SB210]
MGQNKSKQIIQYTAEPLQIEVQPKQQYLMLFQGKEYNIIDYFDESHVKTSYSTCQCMLRYLIKKGIEVSKDSLALYMKDSNNEQFYEFQKSINTEKCNFIMLHLYQFYLQIRIVDIIQQCKQLIKINVQAYRYAESNDQLIQLFGKIIDYYEQSNCLQDVYFKISSNTIKIDCENKYFSIEIFKQHPPQEQDIQQINLFAMKSKCKFNKIYINIYAEILKNRIFSIIDFLQNNQEELQKLDLIFFNDFQDEEVGLALYCITQIFQEQKKLNEVSVFLTKDLNQIQFDIYEYIIKNQNMEKFTINDIGICDNLALIYFDLQKSMEAQLVIKKIIQNNPKIQILKLKRDFYLQGQFLQNFEVEIPRRIKLQIEINSYNLTQQQYLKILKQISHVNQFEIAANDSYTQGIQGKNFINILNKYENEIKLYAIIYLIIKKQLQKVLYHKAEYSFIDLYIDQ